MKISRCKFENFILNNKDEVIINNNINQNKVLEIETLLAVKLPSDYEWFLRKYGFLMAFGVEILGVGKADEPTVVRETLRFRKLGLPENLIVIQNCDEWVNCLDVSKAPDEVCIFTWDIATKNSTIKANGFFDYWLQILNEGKELWDED